jgi:hypothetical protein
MKNGVAVASPRAAMRSVKLVSLEVVWIGWNFGAALNGESSERGGVTC